ncbi:MAG: secondary thiamine-phosphate synthase enzyme YjbQ [Bacteroidetes bacterium]|nr:secondary thiamine-phosphate synthase enzyme YjbQ [Bacteroidota bacterium]
MIDQYHIKLQPKSRGFHLITTEILENIPSLPEKGIFHLYIQHTSAGLTINENADVSVRVDFENVFNRLVKENESYYTHTLEGSDDMPAHIKAALVGTSVSIPITNHRLNLGTWQGIYLCEFRNRGGARNVIVTVYG